MNKFKTESPTSIEAHLAKLYARINYEKQDRVTPRHFKLINMQEILERLDNPHLKYPVIHVAGTKGKGSVSTMVGQILTSSERRTGVYTSPHLESIHQRMAVDGVLITDRQLVDTLTELDPVIKAMDREADRQQRRHLTFFEITTAAALLFFANQQCDAVVLEVGLGGRLDSTNVCQPVTSIITNISIDHTRQLGSTVDKIAYEKAGIIKPSVPVVSGALDPAAANSIVETATEKNAPLLVLDQDFEFSEPNDQDMTFTCSGRIELPDDSPGLDPANQRTSVCLNYEISDLILGLIGKHQRANAAIAVAAIQILVARGWEISDNAIRTGLGRATLAGRMEIVSRHPAIVIDMAHNVASIDALVDALRNDLPQWKTSSKRTCILATSRDKDATGMLRPLVESFDEIILTRYQDNPRGKSEIELLEIGKSIQAELHADSRPASELIVLPNPETAWQHVLHELDNDQLVCITGSAFLVAEIRKTILASFKPAI